MRPGTFDPGNERSNKGQMGQWSGVSPWPVGGGRMGAILRARGQAMPHLDFVDAWDEKVRGVCELLLRSRSPMWLAWGPSRRFIYNDPMADLLGGAHPAAFGQPLDSACSALATAVGGMSDADPAVLAEIEIEVDRHGGREAAWFKLSLTPILRGEQDPVGVFACMTETTTDVLAERGHAFRRRLDDDLRRISTARGVKIAAAGMLGDRLGVGRAGYAEIDPSGDWFTVEEDWTDGRMASLAGRRRLDDFGPEVIAELRAGRAIVIEDPRSHAATAAVATAYAAIGLRAAIAVPLIKHGRFAAAFFVHHSQPRRWRDDEVALVQAVAERTWAAVERARAEEAVRRLNDLLGAEVGQRTRERDRIWRNARDLLVVIGEDGIVQAVNPAWTEILGHSAEATIGRAFSHFVHPHDVEASEAAARNAFGEKTQKAFENRYMHKDGGVRWVSWTAVPEDGQIYAVGRHITADKEAREELAAANRQLLAQIEEREKVEATLRQMQRLEAVGQLTAGTAHDFNNLLTIILGNLEFLQRGLAASGADRRTLERLANMKAAAQRGAVLTSQLLAFARRQRLDPKPVDLNETIAGMRTLLQSTLGSNLRAEMKLDANLWSALVDPTQIELVLLNLAINARDAMKGGGLLTVETANVRRTRPAERPEEPGVGDFVVLTVADSGAGMRPEVLAKAFEPFFTTKEVGKGSGLGLAQVYGFAKQSGGGVRIESQLGKGTTVRVFLPRASGDGGRPSDAAAPGSSPDPAPNGRPRRILLVDDDSAVREVTATMLTDIGYDVIEAGSGGAALDVLDREADNVDLLLVDFAMPGMNGADVARAARAKNVRLPVLFVTGYADLAAMRGIGENAIVQKPFSNDQLAGKVAVALGRGAGLPPAACF